MVGRVNKQVSLKAGFRILGLGLEAFRGFRV